MNFFKRKFSFHEEDDVPLDDPSSSTATPSQPPSSFSFQAIANRMSQTISAPTSPARTGESLAAALERSLQDRSHSQPPLPADAKVLLVIDNNLVDWSKYFRNQAELAVRVEQADFGQLDVVSTEHECTVEIRQDGRDIRAFTPDACFVGPGASKAPCGKTILRSLLAAHVKFLNSPTSIIAMMDKSNLKKQLRKLTLQDGSRLPFLPSIHYPHFHRFQPSSIFPMVVVVNEGLRGYGKMKVSNPEELADLEGLLQLLNGNEVEVEPYVDVKYDLHVQKIGTEWKTFIRRGISRHWKSNVGSAVLEQVPTTERQKLYVKAISEHVGRMEVCNIDILVSKEGREFIHGINDVIAFFGESQEEDRRVVCALLKQLLHPVRRQSSTTGNHPAPAANGRHLPRASERPERSEPIPIPNSSSGNMQSSTTSFADDTMGQLKRTFAGIFGDV